MYIFAVENKIQSRGMVIKIEKTYESEFDMYYAFISLYNVVEQWGLTETQLNILVYLIRLGYKKSTKEVICKNLKISEKSLTTNLSYLRTGRVGKKKIKQLLKTSDRNQNITLLTTELRDIKKIIESEDDNKAFYINFGDSDITKKITT
jgi:hypothetical protein